MESGVIKGIGDEVSLVDVDGYAWTWPVHWWMVNDRHGRELSRRYVFVVDATVQNGAKLHHTAQSWAKRYFSPDVQAEKLIFDTPRGPWQRVAEIASVLYRRPGDARYEHALSRPEWLEKSGTGYRFRLPPGCVVTDRGIDE